jgi:hypothetical protein
MRHFSTTLLVLYAGSLSAQSRQPYESPETVAAAVLRADSTRDWRMLLALAHPAALVEYRQDQVRSLRLEDFPGFPGRDPCLTRQIQQRNRYLLDSLYGVPSVDSLARMAPETVFARAERAWAKAPQLPDSLSPLRVLVGSVIADDSTAYVVIEERYTHRPLPDWPERRPQIMTFRRYRSSWRSMLDPDIGHGMSGWVMTSDDCQ